MKFETFINFNGNCREAVEFYARVFKSEVKNLTTCGQAPADPDNPADPADKDLIMYAEVKIGDKNVMFMDMSPKYAATVGNNIAPTVVAESDDEVGRLFDALKEGGGVLVETRKTFFAETYAMVRDKFGIVWHIMARPRPEK
jgi:PhnB protein